MIHNFEDFTTWMYVLVDDVWQQIAQQFKRPGPKPTTCSDSELITMALVGACRGWEAETELLSEWASYPHLFPKLPERSRFNRRRRQLMGAINLIRQIQLRLLDVAQDAHCVIDSLPVSVVEFHWVPQASREWAAHGADYGHCAAKKQLFFGYRLHLLLTIGGVIVDFTLTSATADERDAAREMLEHRHGLTVLGDKGYVSQPLAEELQQKNQIRLLALRRKNQRQQWPAPLRRLVGRYRQMIETINSQLDGQFGIEQTHAHSFWGLCARLHTKLAAHTLSIVLNRQLGVENWLQIKRLAFPLAARSN